MKKLSAFIIVLLIILIASLVFVLQNNSVVVALKFFGWSFPSVSVGLLTLIMFFAGFIVMWLISLMIYIGNASRHRKEVKERDALIKKLEEEKDKAKKECEEKIKKLEEKLKGLEGVRKQTTQKEAEETPIEEKTKEPSPEKDTTEEKPKRRGLFRRK